MTFEAEYILNKIWNVKRYDENGNILYEIKNGNGKVKFKKSNIEFDGEYINGEMNGKVKEYFEGKIKFE